MLIVAAVVGVGCFLYGCLAKNNCTWRYMIRPVLISHAIFHRPQEGDCTGFARHCRIKETKWKGQNNHSCGIESKGIKYEIRRVMDVHGPLQ